MEPTDQFCGVGVNSCDRFYLKRAALIRTAESMAQRSIGRQEEEAEKKPLLTTVDFIRSVCRTVHFAIAAKTAVNASPEIALPLELTARCPIQIISKKKKRKLENCFIRWFH